MKHYVQGWDIRITTVEQIDPECDGRICEGCEAPCCKGNFFVLLTEDEVFSGKYPITFLNISELSKELLDAKNIIGLAMDKDKCFFLIDENNQCKIYKDRPEACRIYDCRKDIRPEFKDFVKKRFENGSSKLYNQPCRH